MQMKLCFVFAVGNTGGWLLAGTPHGYGHGLNIDDISLVVGVEGAGATPNGMTITFNYFDVEPHSSCSYDYFRVCYIFSIIIKHQIRVIKSNGEKGNI